jgi:hypothetical protein
MMQALRSPLLLLEGVSPIRCLLLRMRETRCNEVGSWGVGHERPRSSSGSVVLIEPGLWRAPVETWRRAGRRGTAAPEPGTAVEDENQASTSLEELPTQPEEHFLKEEECPPWDAAAPQR